MAKPKKAPKNGQSDMIGHNYSKEDRAKQIKKAVNTLARHKREKDKLAGEHREDYEKNVKAVCASLGVPIGDLKYAAKVYMASDAAEDKGEQQLIRDSAMDVMREVFEAMTGDQADLFGLPERTAKLREAQAAKEAEGKNTEAE